MGNNTNNYLKLLVDESTWYNEMLLPQFVRDVLPHFLQSWLRNCICGVFVFAISTLLLRLNYWKYYSSSPKENVATRKEMMKQIKESMELMPSGALFLTVTEHLAETGWTRCYTRISDVGLIIYVLSTLVYLAVIEVWTYWIHRYMHEIRPIYRLIHSRHHSYNKESSLSPFAGWALHPLDGILMELPHGIAFLMVPTHFFTHLALYLTEAMWGVFAEASIKAILSIVSSSSHEPYRENLVKEGVVHTLITYIVEVENCKDHKDLAPKATKALELVLELESGKQAFLVKEVLNDGIEALIKMVFRVSGDDLGSESAVNCLMKLCYESLEVSEKAICGGILTQLLLLLQSQCSGRAKSRARMLLKLLRSMWAKDPIHV